MTSVGHRPTLGELLRILDTITEIVADIRATNPREKEFSIILTFSRYGLAEAAPDWIDGLPKPTWLIEEIKDQLAQWSRQKIREAQWVSKEDRFGAGIDSVMAYWAEELKSAAKGNGLSDRVRTKFIPNTILRLQELKERRDAGGVYSATENRREKDRKTWAEDEYEGPKREEEQRRQRERRNGPDGPSIDDMFRQYGEYIRQQYNSSFNKTFEDAMYGRGDPFREGFRRADGANVNPPPPSGNKRQWFEILAVSPSADKKDITKAHRKLASKYHPDRYKEADGHAKMAEINTARDEGLGGL
jgi:DnaJ-domain-containing protein 1